jgi:hypothetical protein
MLEAEKQKFERELKRCDLIVYSECGEGGYGLPFLIPQPPAHDPYCPSVEFCCG